MEEEYSSEEVSVEVTNYMINNHDTNSNSHLYYNNHIFTIRVWMDKHRYDILRSYDAFCELDAKFRRQYSRSQLPTLPLDGAPVFANNRLLAKQTTQMKVSVPVTTTDTSGSIIDTPTPKIIERKERLYMIRKQDLDEAINRKKMLLTNYLLELLKIPEIAISELLLNFLDEESQNGEAVDEEDITDTSEVHVLLEDEPILTKTVIKNFKVSYNVKANDIIIWKFSTRNRDIGFSISLNDVETSVYRRYSSHEKEVYGSFEVVSDGKVELIWDNSYSKMRSKYLLYCTKIIDSAKFETARVYCIENKKRKQSTMKQRVALKKLLSKMSTESMSVMGLNSRHSMLIREVLVNNDILLEDDSDLSKEMIQLQEEKLSLQNALGDSEAAIVSERAESAKLVQELEDLTQQKDSLEDELQSLQSEIETLKSNLIEKDLIIKELRDERSVKDIGDQLSIDDLMTMSLSSISPNYLYSCYDKLRNYVSEVMKGTSEVVQKQVETEEQLKRLKNDRKMLKRYGLECNKKIGMLEASLQSAQEDKLLAQHERSMMQQSMSELQEEINKFKSYKIIRVGNPSQKSSHNKVDDTKSDKSSTDTEVIVASIQNDESNNQNSGSQKLFTSPTSTSGLTSENALDLLVKEKSNATDLITPSNIEQEVDTSNDHQIILVDVDNLNDIAMSAKGSRSPKSVNSTTSVRDFSAAENRKDSKENLNGQRSQPLDTNLDRRSYVQNDSANSVSSNKLNMRNETISNVNANEELPIADQFISILMGGDSSKKKSSTSSPSNYFSSFMGSGKANKESVSDKSYERRTSSGLLNNDRYFSSMYKTSSNLFDIIPSMDSILGYNEEDDPGEEMQVFESKHAALLAAGHDDMIIKSIVGPSWKSRENSVEKDQMENLSTGKIASNPHVHKPMKIKSTQDSFGF